MVPAAPNTPDVLINPIDATVRKILINYGVSSVTGIKLIDEND
jgi:hypothetical protein